MQTKPTEESATGVRLVTQLSRIVVDIFACLGSGRAGVAVVGGFLLLETCRFTWRRLP